MKFANTLAAVVVVAAFIPGRVQAQETGSQSTQINTTSAGYLGILNLRCDCTLSTNPDVRRRFFVFRSDPVVTRIETGSAAAAVLMRGDAITHIDGVSIRTTDGARRFASITPGQRVALTYRRNGRSTVARLTAAALDWNDMRILGNVAPELNERPERAQPPEPAEPPEPVEPVERPTPVPRAPAAPRGSWAMIAPSQGAGSAVWAVEVPSSLASPKGWFGFSIRCNECGWSSGDRPGESPVWESKNAPELSMISSGSPAARAGLEPGDLLTHIDGVSILSPSGARKFGGVVPRQRVRVTVLRGGRSLTRELTLVQRPEARAAIAAAAAVSATPAIPSAPARPATPAARRELRYTGRLEDVTVEVWSSGGPTVERIGDTMVISVGGTIVRLRVDPKK